MDVSTLAGQAIELIAGRMITTGSPDGVNDEDIAGLWPMVAQRLGQAELGSAILKRLQEQPSDRGRRGVAASALAQAAASDTAFRSVLHQAVYGTPAPAEHTAISHQANVNAAGNMTISGSKIAGSIDESSHRSTRVSTGGWIVAGLLALSIGTTGVIAATSGPTDPTEIGTEKNEDGVREAATGYLEAFVAKDGPRTCAFIRTKERDVSIVENCAQYLDTHVFNTMSADGFEKMKTVTVDKVEFFNNPNVAEAHLIARTQRGTDPLRLEYESGRWFIDVNIKKLGGS